MSADFLQSERNWAPEPTGWTDWGIAFLVFAATMALLLSTMNVGIPRDESFYFHAADLYLGWFEEMWVHWRDGELWKSFTKANIDKHWSYNAEHPVLMKTLFALSDKTFHDWLGWMKASTAMRLPGAVCGAGTVAICYLFGRQLFGRLAGLVAAGALLFQPRFFFHSHLACFDVPVTFFWVATVYAYWRSYDSRWWALLTGVMWGFALLTKLNSFFLPIVLAGHWLATHWKEIRIRRTDRGTVIDLPALPWAFVAMLVVGPLMFYALTPRYWFDTWERLQWYLNFHLGHVHYFVYYFGHNIEHPPLPISYPWVMTVLTVPATLLLAAGFGLTKALLTWDPVRWADRWYGALIARRMPPADAGDPRGTPLLLALNLLFPIALISMPETPIFGGTKHWMPAMAFLAILAGAGAALAVELVTEHLHGPDTNGSPLRVVLPASLLVMATILGPAVQATSHNHPWGTSYYNELIGGVRGAADHKMFRQFWGYASHEGLPWINANIPEGKRLWLHNTTGYAWWHYEREELARKDLRTTHTIEHGDYGLFHHQKAFAHILTKVWSRYDTLAPVHVVSHDGVPMLSIYRNEKKAPKAE